VGGLVIGILQTGQIALRPLTQADFERVCAFLKQHRVSTDVSALKEAFFATQVIASQQHGAVLRLLEVFASHLALAAEEIATADAQVELQIVQRARQFIEERYADNITLAEVAKAASTSVFHFCKVFKRTTGNTFTEHLSMVRVAKAKRLLANPHKRVSEIAFAAGFSSLTHFNRTFRQIVGHNPTEYRLRVVSPKLRESAASAIGS
jgi:AraC-like DNA-binding protein